MKSVFTTEQLAERRTRLGASEVAAALGLSSYQTMMELWCIKTGRMEDGGDSFPARRGRALEPLAMDIYEEEKLREGEVLWRNTDDTVCVYAAPWIAATVDGVVYCGEEPRRLVEAKSANRHVAHKFGPEGSDEVPIEYVIQCAWQMMVWDLPACDLIAIVEDEPRFYTIHRNDDLERKMLAGARSFWQMVEGDTPPELDGSDATRAFLESEFPTAGVALRDADDGECELVKELRIAKELLASAEEEYKRVKHEVAALIGDDKGIAGDFGSIHYTSRKQERTDWKAVALEAGASPDLVDAHTKTLQMARAIYPYFKKES